MITSIARRFSTRPYRICAVYWRNMFNDSLAKSHSRLNGVFEIQKLLKSQMPKWYVDDVSKTST